MGLLVKGRDATFIKGRTFEVFSDESASVAAVAASTPTQARLLPQSPVMPARQGNGWAANDGGLSNAVNVAGDSTILSNTSVMHTVYCAILPYTPP